MADRKPTTREIEREVEQERAELRGTVEELFNRFTFDEVWHRVGAYMRDNRNDFGHSFGRVVKEKPLAVALTAVGVGWLLFGPSQQEPRSGGGRPADRSPRRAERERTRRRLEEAEFADRTARGPESAHAEADPWTAPSRTPSRAAPLGATSPGGRQTREYDTTLAGGGPTGSAVPGPRGGTGASGATTIPPASPASGTTPATSGAAGVTSAGTTPGAAAGTTPGQKA